jgi:heterotetrameric sarcosine oxidase gamma subunit
VTRLTETAFLVVTGAASATRDLAWLRRHIPEEAHCTVTDVTSAEAVIVVMGPNARRLLQPLTDTDLSNAAFPFGTAQEIELGMGMARAHRVTYVGELGWELYVPTDMARVVFDTIMATGPAHDLKLAGLHALNSLRIEKAYRHFGHDVTDEDHILDAGLGFAVKPDKKGGKFGDFIGREAVARKKERGSTSRLLQFKLTDPEPLVYHNEPIWSGKRIVGQVRSGAYGHTLGGAIALGYVTCEPEETPEDIARRSYEIEIAGTRFPAVASARPMYDPKGERVRG